MQSSPRLLQYLVDFISYVRRHFFLNLSKIEIAENSKFFVRLLQRHCFYLSNVIIAGLAGGDWSELRLE